MLLALLCFRFLCIRQIKLNFVLGNFCWFSPNHAPKPFFHIQKSPQIFSDSFLKHQLVIFALKVLQHFLISATMNLRKLKLIVTYKSF